MPAEDPRHGVRKGGGEIKISTITRLQYSKAGRVAEKAVSAKGQNARVAFQSLDTVSSLRGFGTTHHSFCLHVSRLCR
jgi:hypothetical protein